MICSMGTRVEGKSCISQCEASGEKGRADPGDFDTEKKHCVIILTMGHDHGCLSE